MKRNRGTYRGRQMYLSVPRSGPRHNVYIASRSINHLPITLEHLRLLKARMLFNAVVPPVDTTIIQSHFVSHRLPRIQMGTVKDGNDIEEFYRCLARQKEFCLLKDLREHMNEMIGEGTISVGPTMHYPLQPAFNYITSYIMMSYED